MLSDSAVSKRKAIPRRIRAAAAGALGLAAAGGLAAFAGPASAADLPGTAGGAPPAVFVQTDNPAGNQVIALAQRPDGQLSQEQVVSTGGLGGIEAATPAGFGGLASAGSLTYDPGHHLLFAVNAGSDTISVLSVEGSHVRLDQVLGSGGEFPNSIAVPFQVGPSGLLSTAPAVTPDDSNGPFSLAFTPSGQLAVAEVAPSALHTFAFGPSGTLTSLSASVPDGQVAQCWVIAADGFYYAANTGSANLSEYTVAADGTPSLVAPVAVTTTGAGPEDLAASANGKYLYDEVGAVGAVDEFRINSDGSLTPIGSVPGLGAGIEGIAAG